MLKINVSIKTEHLQCFSINRAQWFDRSNTLLFVLIKNETECPYVTGNFFFFYPQLSVEQLEQRFAFQNSNAHWHFRHSVAKWKRRSASTDNNKTRPNVDLNKLRIQAMLMNHLQRNGNRIKRSFKIIQEIQITNPHFNRRLYSQSIKGTSRLRKTSIGSSK